LRRIGAVNRHSTAVLALALLATCGHGAAAEPVTAVWKARELFFSYSSAVDTYSCDALKTRVTRILLELGARPDLQVKVLHCNPTGPSTDGATFGRGGGTWDPATGQPTFGQPAARSSYVRAANRTYVADIRVHLSMPAEMTPDVLEEMKADKSRRALISRVTGDPLIRFNDPIPFAAERRVVTLSRKTLDLEPVDCELLEQLVDSSFRELELRVVQRGPSCDPGRTSYLPPQIEVEALVPVTPESR
jgi:hypothetical protein